MTGASARSAWLSGAAALFAAAAFLPVRAPELPPYGRPVMEEFALTDMSAVLGGARRAGADLAFIQMLQYYSSAEPSEDGRPHGEHAHGVGEGTADLHPEVRLTSYGALKDHVLRAAALDPFFHYAYLFGAGALAFNLNRTDEALELLARGARADPSYWQFRLYAGAIAYRRQAEVEKVVALLEEAMAHPDCPTMLKNILANIYKKIGRPARAAEIYRHILETSRDAGYAELARRELERFEGTGNKG